MGAYIEYCYLQSMTGPDAQHAWMKHWSKVSLKDLARVVRRNRREEPGALHRPRPARQHDPPGRHGGHDHRPAQGGRIAGGYRSDGETQPGATAGAGGVGRCNEWRTMPDRRYNKHRGTHASSGGHSQYPQARRRGVPDRLSGQPHHRGGGRGRHPHDHRATGAHRPAHGRRGEPHDIGRAHRSLRHAARAGRGELLRRRCAGVRRFRADRGAAWRLPAAAAQHPTQLQLVPQLPAHHQMG